MILNTSCIQAMIN